MYFYFYTWRIYELLLVASSKSTKYKYADGLIYFVYLSANKSMQKL